MADCVSQPAAIRGGSTRRGWRPGCAVETARRAGRRAARRPTAVGGLHERGHRVDRRRLLGGAPSGARTRCWPPSSTRPCGSRPRPTARSRSSASTATAGSTPPRCSRAIRDDTALVHVQWGNHEVGTRPARRRGRRRVPRAGRARARRRRAGAGHDADRVRRPRRRPAVGVGPQARRSGRDRRPARAPRPAHPAAAASAATRSGPAAPGSSRWRPSPASAPPPPPSPTAGSNGRRPPSATSPTASLAGRARRSTASTSTATPSTGSPTSSASASTASSRRPSCSASTGPASPPTPGRRARPRRSSRHPCSRRWASTPTAACACRSAGRSTDADVDAALAALPDILDSLALRCADGSGNPGRPISRR